MAFESILFETTKGSIGKETLAVPEFFPDLNLDQIINAITAGSQEYNLKPFFYTPLRSISEIYYRHGIMQDLEDDTLLGNIKTFASNMRTMRRYIALADKLYYQHHKNGWYLEAVETYCDAVLCLVNDLISVDLKSRGFVAFRQYMISYVNSEAFKCLLMETKKLRNDLSSIKYSFIVKGNCIQVCKYQSEIDYSADVETTFEKFKRGAVQDYRVKLPTGTGMNHVEAQILDLVAKLYSGIFMNLDNYCKHNGDFIDTVIHVFDREIQFYVVYLDYIRKFKETGLRFCYPEVSDQRKEIYSYEGFDLALANKLIGEKAPIVCNDFYLKDQERIFVVSGPNQGGKTTFARAFGQLHYLASIGCPVPGREARLFLFDNLFTHFEKEENIQSLSGKLQDDLVRIHHILNQATSNSIIIMNEIFTSTTLKDAVFLGKKVMDKIMELDLLCVCVTFVDELSSLSDKTVSMVSIIVPENPAIRTYRIVRKPADGLSYAISIAEKHRLTYDHIKERIMR